MSSSGSSSSKSRIEYLIDEINAKNAKCAAFVLVLGFVAFHGLLHVRYGTDTCRWLLNTGRYKGDKEWQPCGCMMHKYSKIDTRRCLRYLAFYGTHTYFMFIGDERIRDLYEAFVNHLKLDSESHMLYNHNVQEYTDLVHVDKNLNARVEFIWAPNLVRSRMISEFQNWSRLATDLKHELLPSVVIAGTSLWSINETVDQYKENLTKLELLIHELTKMAPNSKVLWAMRNYPVNTVENAELERYVEQYNAAAQSVLRHSGAHLWVSLQLLGHLSEKPLRHSTQILLNMYCNDHMNFDDGTCCSSAEPYTTLQLLTFAVLLISIHFAVAISLYKRFWRRDIITSTVGYSPLSAVTNSTVHQLWTCSHAYSAALRQPLNAETLFWSLTKLALIMGYFFLCDRTTFFMKENKYYSEFSFWIPIAYITAVGLFFTEHSQYTKVLHRDQLSEWRGWMLLAALVYNVTGAGRVLSISMHMKCLISAFLFLQGYEQFVRFWYQGDEGVIGLVSHLFRLNAMAVVLCLCMNRPYQFYHYVPLLSFWYVMVYIMLVVPPQITAAGTTHVGADGVTNWMRHQYCYLLAKFVIFFMLITVLFMSEVLFEKVFVTRPWKALFVSTDDDIHDWWSKWKLDRYSSMYGMLCALLLILTRRYQIYDDDNHQNLMSRGVALSATLAALLGIGGYTAATIWLCRTESECTEVHSYVVFIPIVAYIVLRNISGVLRTRYSTLFSWFGEISLELFISQYHIWLAADMHGVLVLLPGYPVLNVLITAYIFVCAAHEMHTITTLLECYAVPQHNLRAVLKHVLVFIAILIPIGINDGMF